MLRRVGDFSGILVSVCTLIFGFGVIYKQVHDNTKELEKRIVFIQEHHTMRIELDILKLKQEYQKEWQSDFMDTFKEMVTEMKTTNANVQRQSYQLQAIEKELKNVKEF